MKTVEELHRTIVNVARIAYEVNRAYCESLGDHSQPKWEYAAAWQRDSVVNGVRFHLLNPSAGPEASHNNWMKEKIDQGWKYGIKRDSEKREHPCLVPFDDLLPTQQAKDFIFRAVVHSILIKAND